MEPPAGVPAVIELIWLCSFLTSPVRTATLLCVRKEKATIVVTRRPNIKSSKTILCQGRLNHCTDDLLFTQANIETMIANAEIQKTDGSHQLGCSGFPKNSATAANRSPTTPNVIEIKLSIRPWSSPILSSTDVALSSIRRLKSAILVSAKSYSALSRSIALYSSSNVRLGGRLYSILSPDLKGVVVTKSIKAIGSPARTMTSLFDRLQIGQN